MLARTAARTSQLSLVARLAPLAALGASIASAACGSDDPASSAGRDGGASQPSDADADGALPGDDEGGVSDAAPAADGAGPAPRSRCRFDSRAFVTLDNVLVETITAYGRYWNFRADDGSPLAGSGSDLTSVGRYAAGPCVGRAAGSCLFDTRTFVPMGPELWESIVAHGRYANFKLDGSVIAGSGSDLTTVARYAAGPCSGRAAGTCAFQTRTMATLGNDTVESITAYGRYWNFVVGQDTALEGQAGGDLSAVERYGSGPCNGRAASTCVFDTRTMVTLGGKALESITAYGRYWNFPVGENVALEGNAGAELALVDRYQDICKLAP